MIALANSDVKKVPTSDPQTAASFHRILPQISRNELSSAEYDMLAVHKSMNQFLYCPAIGKRAVDTRFGSVRLQMNSSSDLHQSHHHRGGSICDLSRATLV